jgi:hypothetical protein
MIEIYAANKRYFPKVQAFMDGVYAFIGLPQYDIEDVSAKNTRDYPPLSPEV